MYFTIHPVKGWAFFPIPVHTSSKTLAAGEIVIKGDEIISVEFSTGDAYGRFCALTDLSRVAKRFGLSIRPLAARPDARVITGFGWLDGKLYFGQNHFTIWEEASYWNKDLVQDAWKRISDPNASMNPNDEPMAFGYIFDEGDHLEAEFYSDYFEADQDEGIYNKVFKALQARYPELTTFTTGPDEETVQKANDWADKKISFVSDGKHLQVI